jgi:hypothetical protein
VQARWLRELLAESTKGINRDLWVLNPKALPKFLEHEQALLAPKM